MSNGSSASYSIQSIPEEVRGKIFNYVPQNQAPNLQLVCKLWDQDLKAYYNYEIVLDERSRFFKQILQLRIRKLNIVNLVKHQLKDPRSQDPLGIFFRYPELLEEIRVDYETFVGQDCISAQNLQQMLQICQESLKSIKIDLTPEQLSHPFPPNINYNFKKLSSIKTRICNFRKIEVDSPDIWNNGLFSQISNSKIPNLRSLTIIADTQFSVNDPISLEFPLVNLLTKNSKGLKNLIINFREVKSSTIRPFKRWLPGLDLLNISNLKVLTLGLGPSSHQEVDLGMVLIAQQTNLERLVTLREFLFPAALLRSTVLRNYRRIVVIRVDALDVKIGESFDLSIFKKCSNLKHIFLRNGEHVPRLRLDGDGDLVNLTLLPRSIKILKFLDFDIRTMDIFYLLHSGFVNELSELVLINCGVSLGFGLTGVVVNKAVALQHTKLSKMILQGFNLSDKEMFKCILSIMGHPGFDPVVPFYLEISRD